MYSIPVYYSCIIMVMFGVSTLAANNNYFYFLYRVFIIMFRRQGGGTFRRNPAARRRVCRGRPVRTADRHTGILPTQGRRPQSSVFRAVVVADRTSHLFFIRVAIFASGGILYGSIRCLLCARALGGVIRKRCCSPTCLMVSAHGCIQRDLLCTITNLLIL